MYLKGNIELSYAQPQFEFGPGDADPGDETRQCGNNLNSKGSAVHGPPDDAQGLMALGQRISLTFASWEMMSSDW